MHQNCLDISNKLSELTREMEEIVSIINECEVGQCSSSMQKRALSSGIMTLYTGIESIMKSIATEIDGEAPKGDDFHAMLLLRISKKAPNRDAVITNDLYKSLSKMLSMRHKIRHAYGFCLDEDITLEGAKKSIQVTSTFIDQTNEFIDKTFDLDDRLR